MQIAARPDRSFHGLSAALTMYISKIEVKNIRGFTDLSFDLDRGDGTFAGWTVFTGDNGSGKSTLLKAIAAGLAGGAFVALDPSYIGWVRRVPGVALAGISLYISRVSKDDDSGDEIDVPQAVLSEVVIRAPGSVGGAGTSGGPFGLASDGSRFMLPGGCTFLDAQANGWFSCGYGPFRRVFGASPEATRQMVAPSTERYVTMFQEAATLFEATKWLQDLKFKALEDRAVEKETLDLVLEMLQDDLLPNGLEIDRVDSDGLWLRDRGGVRLAWTDMSDGYRSVLALLVDILRHLVSAFGSRDLTRRGEDGKLYVTRSGVVLIDEIDAHMHPEWQREIGFWLKKHFPKIQFLVTTHSPIICQAADPNGLFVLPEPGSGDKPRALNTVEYEEVIRSRPDTILLSPAFGLQNTRSERVVEARAEYTWLDAKKLAGAELSPSEVSRMQELLPLAITDEEL